MSDKSEIPMDDIPKEAPAQGLSYAEQRRLDRQKTQEALELKQQQTKELINSGKREIKVNDRAVIDEDSKRGVRVEAAKRYYHRLMVANGEELRSSSRARDKVPDVLRNTVTSGWIESNGEWVLVPNGINKLEDNRILWGDNATILEPIAKGEHQVNVFSVTIVAKKKQKYLNP